MNMEATMTVNMRTSLNSKILSNWTNSRVTDKFHGVHTNQLLAIRLLVYSFPSDMGPHAEVSSTSTEGQV